MKRILVMPEGEREIEVDPGALRLERLEEGTIVAVLDGQVIRVTQSGGKLLVNGKMAALALEDPRNRRRNGNAGSEGGRREIKAAMPGKVVRVLVEPGQTVEAGQGLLILEAMKMQNEVRSPGAGTVGGIRVREGGTVASGQVLVTLE